MMAAGKPGLRATRSARLLALLVVSLVLAVWTISFAAVGQASTSGKVQNQSELNKEACDDYKKADAELNQAYQAILRDYGRDRAFIASLRKAQLAWVRYRDAHLESIYPGDASQYGSVMHMCRCNRLAEVTRERIKDLKQWIEGVEEGDVCAGSVKVKG